MALARLMAVRSISVNSAKGALWKSLFMTLCALCSQNMNLANAQVPSSVYQTQIYGRGNADSQPGNQSDPTRGKSAMVVDLAGNIYVTGTTFNGLNADFLTVKYSAAGAILWRTITNGIANGNDIAYAIALDPSGNVFVTGSTESGGQTDYLTVKYDNDGVELWRKSLDGGANRDDAAYAIVVDASGNAFVTGAANPTSTGTDYVTVKYSPIGTELWRIAMAGTGNTNDVPAALCLDSAGNAVVTGYGVNGNSPNYDYITVKYIEIGGMPFEAWSPRRQFNSNANSFDIAFAMACDQSGNIYVTGRSHNGSNFDYVTVKYNSSGISQWIPPAAMNGTGNATDTAVAIAVDASGNVIVTGQSEQDTTGIQSVTNPMHLTVKYSAGGVEQWRAALNGSGTGVDAFSAIATDATGNIYATGFADNAGSNELAVVKYTPAGGVSPGWPKFVSGMGSANGAALLAINVDIMGNFVVSGYRNTGLDNHFLVVKFDASGNELWRKDEGENTQLAAIFASGQSGKNALAVDGTGNVFVTGQSGIFSVSDFVTAKIGVTGIEQWRTVLNGPTGGVDRAYALAIDAGNTYVTGESFTGYNSDFITVKYDSTGMEAWRAQPGHAVGVSNSARAITAVPGGDVVVTGTTSLSNDFLTIKYRGTDGAELWKVTANSGGANMDTPVAIAADAVGNTIVTGKTIDSNFFDGYFTVKYDAVGTEVWRKPLSGNASAPLQPFALVLDSFGNAIVAGDVVIKYAAGDGAALWQTNETFRALTVALAPDGSVVTAGTGGMIAKYIGSNGSAQWRHAINGVVDGNDVVYSVAVDLDGNIYATTRNLGDSNASYVTVKLAPDGTERWRVATGTGGSGGSANPALMLDTNRNVIVAGNAIFPGLPIAIVVAKFSQAPPPPSNVVAIAGNTVAKVSFSPPTGLEAPVTSYTATCGAVTVSGAVSPIFVTGLMNEMMYQCSVTSISVYGTGTPSAPVSVTPSTMAPLALFSVQSRMMHGTSGDFALDVDMAPLIAGAVSVEPRAVNGSHRVVFNFNTAISVAGSATATNIAMADLGTATATKAVNTVEVLLPAISDATRVKVSLSGVNNDPTVFTASIGFLYGDVSRSRAINAADIAAIKVRGGQPVATGDNYRFDINLNGAINAIDVSAVKARSGFTLP